ncbi:hypothetical protein [Burkholderia sp. BE17]|uniref:hypothetical protein n=1 Tax=Burkholderia sp. BE17 TaxID=2656644 RepID=UPI00128C22A4|nr:hypothetical protein [Burkholderia sp. BE17]MPV69414.1 hypothetical protein [Burkholderia sp. BE17]
MPWPKGKKMPPEMLARRSATAIANGKRRKKPVVLDGVNYWKCGRCSVFKPESDFYIDGKTAAGVSSQCRTCHMEGSLRTRNPDNARSLNANYMRRARAADPEKFRARDRESAQQKRILYPEKILARQSLNNAVKRGDVVRPDVCEQCGISTAVAAHHDDYSRPLQVRWLCRACHGKEHRTYKFERTDS